MVKKQTVKKPVAQHQHQQDVSESTDGLTKMIDASPWIENKPRGSLHRPKPGQVMQRADVGAVQRPRPGKSSASAQGNLDELAAQWQSLNSPKSVEITSDNIEKGSPLSNADVEATPMLDESSELNKDTVLEVDKKIAGATKKSVKKRASKKQVIKKKATKKQVAKKLATKKKVTTSNSTVTIKQKSAVVPKKKTVVKMKVKKTDITNGERKAMAKKKGTDKGADTKPDLDQLKEKMEELRRKRSAVREELSSIENIKASRDVTEEPIFGPPEQDVEAEPSPEVIQAAETDVPLSSAMEEEAEREEVLLQQEEAELKVEEKSPPKKHKSGKAGAKERVTVEQSTCEEQPVKTEGQEIVVEDLFDGLANTLGGGLGYVIEKGQSAACSVASSVTSGVSSGTHWVGGLYDRIRHPKPEPVETSE